MLDGQSQTTGRANTNDVPDGTKLTAARRRGLPAHWPLTALLLGYPVWWLLGVAWLAPQAVAVAMVVQLIRRRRLRVPSIFAVWLLFGLWVGFSAFMLWTDAPGAAPGGAGPGRLAIYAYRASWYGAVTVVMVWACTLWESELPSRWVRSCLGWLFVMTIGGGILGLVFPEADFPSLLELVLPGSTTTNPLVYTLIHPSLAEVQDVLGYAGARPVAPFNYTNSWGANLALLLPFFVVAWLREGRPWQRPVGLLILVAGVVPVVLSLNRGLWVSLILMAGLTIAFLIRRGNRAALVLTAASIVLAAVVVAVSPLGSVLSERIASPHSNERRGQLLEQTVTSAAEGSPILGFGSTRDVQGSFTSIAGGATPECSACSVPPLGTQGQIWLVIFSQGLVGAFLFMTWLAVLVALCWRAATTMQILGSFVLLAFIAQLAVYDTLGMPLLVVMLTAGLLGRERTTATRMTDWPRALRAAKRQSPLIAFFAALGLLVGAGTPMLAESPPFAARVAVMLDQVPVSLGSVDALDVSTPPVPLSTPVSSPSTIDTEAAIMVSDRTLAPVAVQSGTAVESLRSRITTTAPSRSQVLVLEVRNPDAAAAQREVAAITSSYLASRAEQLTERRNRAIRQVQSLLGTEQARQTLDEPSLTDSSSLDVALRDALDRATLADVSAGRVLRAESPARPREQIEIPLFSGLAVGLLVGLLLAAWQERSPGASHRVSHARLRRATSP